MENTTRKLASIRRAEGVTRHPNADRLDLVTVGGWTVVTKKDEIKKGDLAVFFEIDSFLPAVEMFSFLGTPITHQGNLGHRLKTVRLRKIVSQGLMLPLDMFYEHKDVIQLREGEDLTELLGVTKFDIDLVNDKKGQPSVTGQPKGKFPSFLRKTAQERIQNLPHYFNLHKDTLFEETLKLDGSSMTAYKVAGSSTSLLRKFLNFVTIGVWDSVAPVQDHYGVCSRNLELTKPKSGDKQSNFWNASDKYSLQDIPVGYAVQGEVLAPNIQANYEKVSEVEYHIFSVFCIETQEYLKPDFAAAWVALNLPKANYVPVVDTAVKLFSECTTFDEIQTRVSGQSINPGVKSEGRVYKALDGSCTFKCISTEYLLQRGK